jgi:hypothetical protein
MADKDDAGTVNTALAVWLLLLNDPAELKGLVRAGWFQAIGPDRWKVSTIVQGRIRALLLAVSKYTGPQMANALGLGIERVRILTNEGVLKQSGKGKYDRDETTRNYVTWLRDQNRLANKTTSEGRVRDARATEIEIRTAERSRRLITLDEAQESNAIVCGTVRTEFGGFAARFTRDLALRRDIEKAVNESLARIADRLNAEALALATGRRADDAVADDDTGPMGEEQSQLSAIGSPAGSA